MYVYTKIFPRKNQCVNTILHVHSWANWLCNMKTNGQKWQNGQPFVGVVSNKFSSLPRIDSTDLSWQDSIFRASILITRSSHGIKRTGNRERYRLKRDQVKTVPGRSSLLRDRDTVEKLSKEAFSFIIIASCDPISFEPARTSDLTKAQPYEREKLIDGSDVRSSQQLNKYRVVTETLNDTKQT